MTIDLFATATGRRASATKRPRRDVLGLKENAPELSQVIDFVGFIARVRLESFT
jgi:hypothetical protein